MQAQWAVLAADGGGAVLTRGVRSKSALKVQINKRPSAAGARAPRARMQLPGWHRDTRNDGHPTPTATTTSPPPPATHALPNGTALARVRACARFYACLLPLLPLLA